MTLQEAQKRFGIPVETLRLYKENGLLLGHQLESGVFDYREEDVRRASQLHALLKAGMDMDSLKCFIQLEDNQKDTAEEQVKLLRKCRCRLLEEIHGKQQSLDQLDYLIYEIRKQKRRKENLSHEKIRSNSIGNGDVGFYDSMP